MNNIIINSRQLGKTAHLTQCFEKYMSKKHPVVSSVWADGPLYRVKKLSAPLALKKYIVEYANEKAYSGYKYEGELNTEQEINAAMSHMWSKIGYDAQQDIMEGEWKTPNIPYELFRHCDSESVAVKDNYENYIGFMRMFSGGKHFDSAENYEYIIEHAYYLTCQEKEVLTIERAWAKV